VLAYLCKNCNRPQPLLSNGSGQIFLPSKSDDRTNSTRRRPRGLAWGTQAAAGKVPPRMDPLWRGREGNEAIQFALELKPDLVVLKITMPGMGGLEASSGMRKLGLNIPVLIFTTHDSERLDAEA
jgi:hypothetical protein